MPSRTIVILAIVLIGFLSACQPQGELPLPSLTPFSATLPTFMPSATVSYEPYPSSAQEQQASPISSPNKVILPTQIPDDRPPTLTLQPTSTPTFNPERWTDLPVVPLLSERVKEIYLFGLEIGNRPNAFSKVGDCGSTPSWFLGDFDRGPRFYNLGEYTHLQTVIDYYRGSFERTSLAALAGYNTSSVLTPLWSNKEFCKNDEAPLACEYRLHRPSIALITLGANDVYHIDSFEPQLRKIIEYSIAQGVIPVLATKPDNLEKDHRINRITAQLAIEYQIPLWNYWKAVQPLPNHALQEDGVHITFAANDFSNPLNMQAGWPIRNLTALQVLYALYTYLNTP